MKLWVGLTLALGAVGCNSSSGSKSGSSSSPASAPAVVAYAVTTSGSTGSSSGSSSSSSSSSGSTSTTAATYPSSESWMTEAQEVAWYNSIGFSTTLAALQASYKSFTPAPISTSTNVEWNTETDDLRNYYRLAKRTGYAGFQQQAQYLHDWYCESYSVPGSASAIGTEHVYMMGMVDWVSDHPTDQAGIAAINRVLAYIKSNLPTSFVETRVTARMLECLCYFKEKLGWTSVDSEIATLLAGIKAAPVYNGFVSFPKYYVGMGETADGQLSGTSLETLFPKDAAFKAPNGTPLIASATTFNLEGFPGVASFQDMILLHALLLASRVENEPSLAQTELTQATAWLQITGHPFWDPTGASTNLVIGYNVVPDAPDLTLFKCYDGESTPLYCTQYAAYCPNPSTMKQLQQQALLRQYNQYTKVQPSELGGKPRYFLWETWEQGYYLTQLTAPSSTSSSSGSSTGSTTSSGSGSSTSSGSGSTTSSGSGSSTSSGSGSSTSSGSGSTTSSGSGSSTSSGSGSSTSSGSTTTTATTYPSSESWMTEAQEVAWYNSIGFNTTLAALQASYKSFTPAPISTSTNVEWNTETDDLRNYYRLYKRTGYAGFLQQAQYLHDWYCESYSVPGSASAIGTEHVYMMGIVDWVSDNPTDQAGIAAINRVLAYIKANVPTYYYETRVSARMLQCLCHFKEKLGWTNVDAEINTLLAGIQAAPVYNGFISFPKYYVGMGETADGQPSGTSLETLFPKDAAFTAPSGTPLIASATTFNLEGFPGVASFQDVMLMHALLVAARVENDPSLAQLSLNQATAWLQVSGYPFWDPTGVSTNLLIGYNVVPDAPDLTLFKCYDGSSTPLYCTQYAAYCPNPTMMKQLQQQAVLRQYNQYAKIQASELGGKPRYYLWETWEQGYFLTQLTAP